MIVVYGRRRIGKTELIEQFYRLEKLPILKFEGIESDENLRKNSEKANLEHIKHAAQNKKYYIDWKVLTKEHLDILARHGAKGAIIWQEPETIIEWLRTPPTIKQ